jgi:hypothetical protein
MRNFNFNFDLLSSGERLRSFDSKKNAKKFAKNHPVMGVAGKHLFLRDNHKPEKSHFLWFSF